MLSLCVTLMDLRFITFYSLPSESVIQNKHTYPIGTMGALRITTDSRTESSE